MSLRILSLTARGYVQPLTKEHCGSVHYITIGDSRLLTAAGLTRSPLYLIGDAASRCGLSRVGYFIPLNGRRPLNGHPPVSLNIIVHIPTMTIVCFRLFQHMSMAKHILLSTSIWAMFSADKPKIGECRWQMQCKHCVQCGCEGYAIAFLFGYYLNRL